MELGPLDGVVKTVRFGRSLHTPPWYRLILELFRVSQVGGGGSCEVVAGTSTRTPSRKDLHPAIKHTILAKRGCARTGSRAGFGRGSTG